jgi:dihydroorotate dehydrogenase (fumarate)
MNLTTDYLGMELRSPIVASASPLSEEIDDIKRIEDAGAGAVVLYSLFEEQIRRERAAVDHYLQYGTESFAEALSIFPEPATYHAKPYEYLEHIRRARAAVDIPVIASINGSTLGGWTHFARRMEEAGASAIELNVYHIATDMTVTGAEVEQLYLDILKGVKAAVKIPVAIKLSPFFSNMAYMAKQLDDHGADALVLFNRFYQPDIDLETLEVRPNVILSTPQALRLPLRWIAILYGKVKASLAATSGIHNAEDVLKTIMAGANVTMMASALLKNGIDHIRTVEKDLREWMDKHEYVSIRQMRGSVSQINSEHPSEFERVQYMRALTTFGPLA